MLLSQFCIFHSSFPFATQITDTIFFLYKLRFITQATAAEVLVAEGSGTLTLTQLFADTRRYNLRVRNAVKRGELFVVTVSLLERM